MEPRAHSHTKLIYLSKKCSIQSVHTGRYWARQAGKQAQPLIFMLIIFVKMISLGRNWRLRPDVRGSHKAEYLHASGRTAPHRALPTVCLPIECRVGLQSHDGNYTTTARLAVSPQCSLCTACKLVIASLSENLMNTRLLQISLSLLLLLQTY